MSKKTIEIDATFGHPRFYLLIKRMAELHSNKNRDYGNGNPLGNFMTAEDLGIDPFDGVLVRMSDKWTRICSLRKQGQQFVKDESIEDTLLDLANYCLLALVIKKHLATRDRIVEEVCIGEGECPGACEDCSCGEGQPGFVEVKNPCRECEYNIDNQCTYEDGECVALEFDHLIDLDIPEGKTYQCLHCTNKLTPIDIHHTCGHCVHRSGEHNYGVDYFVDQRIVNTLIGKADENGVDSKGYRCVGNEMFCACEKCEKARFLNAM